MSRYRRGKVPSTQDTLDGNLLSGRHSGCTDSKGHLERCARNAVPDFTNLFSDGDSVTSDLHLWVVHPREDHVRMVLYSLLHSLPPTGPWSGNNFLADEEPIRLLKGQLKRGILNVTIPVIVNSEIDLVGLSFKVTISWQTQRQ